ncbi:MAG: hypothetical protein JWM27_4239 [Gemmatimonadetes bacterium]|nr:hypothetical protein [Gemmatimonadota bacterium]
MQTETETQAPSGANDFDFLIGSWNVANRRLEQRWVGSDAWDEFPGTNEVAALVDGIGNLEQMRFPTKGWSGITLRLFDRKHQEWSLYWANSRDGVLFPPVVGRFTGARGEFYGDDTDDGKPVRVRFTWHNAGPAQCRWEQAFSVDGGATWETNWTMDFTRADA